MTRARIDHDERTALLVDLDALGRNDADQRIVDRLSELAPIDDEFGGVTQDIRRGLRDLLPVLVAALAQSVEEKHRALPRIHHVFHRVGDDPRHRPAWQVRFFQRHGFASFSQPSR